VQNGDEKIKGRPQNQRKPVRTKDSLADALSNAILANEGAFEDYEFARVNKLGTRSVRLSEFNKSLDGRLKAERAYREEMEIRGVLVPKQQIVEMARRCMETVLRRLNKLPQEQGPQCNPQEPLMAVKILEREVDEIKAAGQIALNDLQS